MRQAVRAHDAQHWADEMIRRGNERGHLWREQYQHVGEAELARRGLLDGIGKPEHRKRARELSAPNGGRG